MIFYYAVDREMLDAMGFSDKDRRSQKAIETIIEEEIKALVFLMPLDKRIVISPSFRFESSTFRQILKRNRELADNGVIVEYRRESDVRDFWQKKHETYSNAMEISYKYYNAYGKKDIYKKVSSIWIDRIPKQKAVGVVSRDVFMQNVKTRGMASGVPAGQIEDVLKITDETREATFLWEVEEHMLREHGIPDKVIRQLGVRDSMNQSYLNAFLDPHIEICRSSLGVVDLGHNNSTYDMRQIKALLERAGIWSTIMTLSAGNILDIRTDRELQDMLDVVRCHLYKKESVMETFKAVSEQGDLKELINKLLRDLAGEKSMTIISDKTNEPVKGEMLQKDTIKLLHLSDLHFKDEATMRKHYFYLKMDLRNIFKLSSIGYLIISGDVSDRPVEEMYKTAAAFVQELSAEFHISQEHIILVPGNHDCDREVSKMAYDKDEKNINDQKKYAERYMGYSKYFYEPVKGKPYPLDSKMQHEEFYSEEDRLCILGLSSCSRIDHKNTEDSFICMDAIQDSSVIWLDENEYVKLAVWHHPLSGWAAIQDITFMDTLANLGFRACFHGHIHEAKNDLFSYDSYHSVRMIGAGTFGAVQKERGDGIPRQYNMLEFDKKQRKLIVHTRKREKDDGIWQADARWEDKNHNPKSFYVVEV